MVHLFVAGSSRVRQLRGLGLGLGLMNEASITPGHTSQTLRSSITQVRASQSHASKL